MVDKIDAFEKTLNKNYGTVQKKEIMVSDSNVESGKNFTSYTVNISKTLKQEMKNHLVLDKEIKAKHSKSLKELHSKYLTHIEGVDSKNKAFNMQYEKVLKVSFSKFTKANEELQTRIEEINNENDQQIITIDNQYNKDVEASEQDKVKINSLAEKSISNLLSTLKDEQSKYETLVVKLNEKRDTKTDKLKSASESKIKKIRTEIEKEQLKVDKIIGDMKPSYEEKLAGINERLTSEKDRYMKKDSVIKSALESRIARHEKFLNKAINQGDNRSIKEHKKNIVGLEKEAVKEAKLLLKEHEVRFDVLDNQKKELLILHKNKIAQLETELVKFKSDKLYQIELAKVSLSKDLMFTELSTKKQLEDELNRYNEYFAENDRLQAEADKTRNINLEIQDDKIVALKIGFDKTNKTNDVKHQEALSVKESEILSTEFIKTLEEGLAKTALEVELAKLESEKVVSEKQLAQSIKINDENEIIEYINNDYNRQASMKTEFLNYQLELSKLHSVRALSISEYEGLELNNRIDLKVAFLEKQGSLIKKDNEGIVEKINQVFKAEKEMYESEIDKHVQGDLEELLNYEQETNDTIKAMIEKRNTFNTKAYRKELKGLDREINDKKATLKKEIEKRKVAINSKTALFNLALFQAEARKDTALNEAEALKSNELSRLASAIELVNNECLDESNDIKHRQASITNDSTNFAAQAEARKDLTEEENHEYKDNRVKKEEERIKDIKSTFEQTKHELTSVLEQVLSVLEKLKAETNEEANNKKLKEKAILESKVKNYNNQISKYNQEAEDLTEVQGKKNKTNLSQIDVRYANHLTRVTEELKGKQDSFKTKTAEVEGLINNDNKAFDSAKKQVQKDYDASLQKGLSIINQKLQQDLKNI